jgi:hypothetical protein
MNKQLQKEYLKGILQYKEAIDSDHNTFLCESFEKDFRQSLSDKLGMDFNMNIEDIDLDALIDQAGEDGVSLIDMLNEMFAIMGGMGKLNHNGQEIDTKMFLDAFLKSQDKFLEYKKSEDINNF